MNGAFPEVGSNNVVLNFCHYNVLFIELFNQSVAIGLNMFMPLQDIFV